MHFIYLDCFSGISGDMLIGALLDSGGSLDFLQAEIETLNLEAKISAEKKVLQGISCTAFKVEAPNAPPLRHLPQIEDVIANSSLPEEIKNDALKVFYKLATAEARVHGIDISRVHFHEVGAVDTIIDVVGALLCLSELGIDQVFASALPWSQGLLDMSHGRYPLPAPAVAELLRGYPCVFTDAKIELVTPTGAALLTHLAENQVAPTDFTPLAVGYGAGTNLRADKVPNLLRIIRAQADDDIGQQETIVILETEVDDLNPEIYTHLYNLCLDHPDVLDIFTTPILMKKNRPGNLITVLTTPAAAGEICRLLMRETGTLGVRYRHQQRVVLKRRQQILYSPWGAVRIKVAHTENGVLHKKPEFEDCQAIARQNNLPLHEVYDRIKLLLNEDKF